MFEKSETKNTATQNYCIVEPLVNIQEEGDKITLEAFMSGLSKEDISIDISGNELTISGKCKKELPGEYRPLYQERVFSEYRRSFVLNVDIDSEKVEAQYKDGVLTLSLPKAELKQAKKIAIQ